MIILVSFILVVLVLIYFSLRTIASNQVAIARLLAGQTSLLTKIEKRTPAD